MKSKFLPKRIELVKREMNDILTEWNMLDPFIGDDDRRYYEYMTEFLKFAVSMFEINGDIIIGDKEDESH